MPFRGVRPAAYSEPPRVAAADDDEAQQSPSQLQQQTPQQHSLGERSPSVRSSPCIQARELEQRRACASQNPDECKQQRPQEEGVAAAPIVPQQLQPLEAPVLAIGSPLTPAFALAHALACLHAQQRQHTNAALAPPPPSAAPGAPAAAQLPHRPLRRRPPPPVSVFFPTIVLCVLASLLLLSVAPPSVAPLFTAVAASPSDVVLNPALKYFDGGAAPGAIKALAVDAIDGSIFAVANDPAATPNVYRFAANTQLANDENYEGYALAA